MNTFFGNFMTKISSIPDLGQQYEVTAYTHTPSLPNSLSTANDAQIWSLYFDGSKSQEGAGASCVLIDPTGNNFFFLSY
jgi:hypothetical protein